MRTIFGLLGLSCMLLAIPEGGTPVPSRTGNTTLPIGATFVDRYRNLSDAQWTEEFDRYRRLGLTHLFIVASGRLDVTGTKIEDPIFPSMYASQSGARDILGLFLQLAQERDMYIHVGSLQTYGDWNTGLEFANLRAMNHDLYREIIRKYGSHKSLVGASLTQELWVNWAWTKKTVEGKDYPGSKIASEFIQDIRKLRQETGKALVTSCAPVFKKKKQGAMLGLAAGEMGYAINEILRLAPFDLMMLQDGIGVGVQSGSAPLEELPEYFKFARAGADGYGTELWATVEVFADDPNIAQNLPRPRHAFRPASIDRIASQIAAVKPHVSGMCMWIAGDHMSETATYEPVAASRLAAQYRARYDSRFSALHPVRPYAGYTYTFVGSQPYPGFTDPMNLKLTDERGLGYNGYIGNEPDAGWNNLHGPSAGVGFYASAGNSVSVIFDFVQTYTKFGRVEVMYKTGIENASNPQDLTFLIPSPETLEVSNDGKTWTAVTQQSRVRPAADARFAPAWSALNVNAEGRFLRLTIPFAKMGWYMIGEVRFFGERDPNPSSRDLMVTYDPPPANRPWFVKGDKIKIAWTLYGPKVEGSNTWIVFESVYGRSFRSIDFEQKTICGRVCGVLIGTKGAVSFNGENSFEFQVPEEVMLMGPTYWVSVIVIGPENVYHWASSQRAIDIVYY